MIRILTLVVVCAVALGAGLYLGRHGLGTPEKALPEQVVFYEKPRALTEFSLVSEENTPLTKESVSGHWTVMYFGFTHCPDICPNSLALLNKVDAELGEIDDAVQYMMVSVDPERDTPERLKDYVRYFNPGFRAATGSLESITAFAKQVGVVAIKVDQDDMPGGYTVDHTSVFALLNPQGNLSGLITAPHTVDNVAAGVRAALARSF